jgi:hypothetical protein
MFLRYQRGQTMVETVLFLPIVLVTLFGVIYFSRFGVVSERTQLSLRYAGISAFFNDTAPSQGAYTAADIYASIFQGNNTPQVTQPGSVPSPCPSPPLGVYSNSAPYQGMNASAPWWQPDSDQSAPSSTCNATVVNLPGASFLALYIAATVPSVSASVDVPSYLRSLLGSYGTVSASEKFAHAAWPGIILACSNKVYKRTYAAITAEGFATPPPAPTPLPTATPTFNGMQCNNGN